MIYDTPGKVFKGIADVIRQFEGSSSPIPVVDMPDRIRALHPTPLSIDISNKTSKNWFEELIPYIYILNGGYGVYSGMSHSLTAMFHNYGSVLLEPFIEPGHEDPSFTPLDLDLSNLYLPSSVLNLDDMFVTACVNSIDLDTWDTRYIRNMNYMFAGCCFNKVWLPKSFVNLYSVDPPFEDCGRQTYASYHFDFEIYTDSTEDRTQEWGIDINYLTVHYNSTHQDFLNA